MVTHRYWKVLSEPICVRFNTPTIRITGPVLQASFPPHATPWPLHERRYGRRYGYCKEPYPHDGEVACRFFFGRHTIW